MLQEIKEMIKDSNAETLLESIEQMLLDALEAHQKITGIEHYLRIEKSNLYEVHLRAKPVLVKTKLWKYLEGGMSFLQKSTLKLVLGDKIKVIDEIPKAVYELHPTSSFYIKRQVTEHQTKGYLIGDDEVRRTTTKTYNVDLKITEVQNVSGTKMQRHVDLKYMLFGSEAPPTAEEISEQTELF